MFHPFVIPFSVGAVFLLGYVFFRIFNWYRKLTLQSKIVFFKKFFSVKLFTAISEIITESLLHRSLFRKKAILGYMHATFALGWLLLIIIGTMESKSHSHGAFNPPYYPIFFKYFVHESSGYWFAQGFIFLMDLLLLLLLIGVGLALYKRLRSTVFGFSKKVNYHITDRIALYALWLIFPLRFLSESFSAGLYHNGGFLTQTAGNFFAGLLPLNDVEIYAWWAYSSVLAVFFVTLPFSRYMHIPAEPFLILLRHFGLKDENKKVIEEVERNACSKCGVCIDVCVLQSELSYTQAPPLYLMSEIRKNSDSFAFAADCLMCGRCKAVCPVGIDTLAQRLTAREKQNVRRLEKVFSRYNNETIVAPKKVGWFMGCMTHLTPSIKKSLAAAFAETGTEYNIIDADGNLCCGRPLLLAGKKADAKQLKEILTSRINSLCTETLVVNCPICLNIFKNEYSLKLNVVHHSEFLLTTLNMKSNAVNKIAENVAYHSPCELGRGLDIEKEPIQLLEKFGYQVTLKNDKTATPCCGGSLGNYNLSASERKKLTKAALNELTLEKTQALITSCPLCLKTFSAVSDIPVMDISEAVMRKK